MSPSLAAWDPGKSSTSTRRNNAPPRMISDSGSGDRGKPGVNLLRRLDVPPLRSPLTRGSSPHPHLPRNTLAKRKAPNLFSRTVTLALNRHPPQNTIELPHRPPPRTARRSG